MSCRKGWVLTLGIASVLAEAGLQAQDARPARASSSDGVEDRLKTIEDRLGKIEATLKALAEARAVPGSPAGGLSFSPESVRQRLERALQGIPRRELSSSRVGAAAAPADDRDQDGLTDAEEARIGTNPENPDTDGDALLDGWEVHGVNHLDLRTAGASPLHKDIFVEMDYMTRDTAKNELKPNDTVLRGIRAVFANAPVANPDGAAGINIHLELNGEVPYQDDLRPYALKFAAIKTANFDRNRAPVYHYMVWANAYDGGTSSGVSMNIPHSDFLVTLGRWNNGQGGDDLQKIGTFVHELGHNLGRRHGGNEDLNYKPNHLSIMNYLFQMRGILDNGNRVFDYQRFPLAALNELSLNEEEGLGRSQALRGYSTIYSDPVGNLPEVAADGAIDWNADGRIENQPGEAADLNGDGLLETLGDTPNEWAQLIFNGGSIGSVATLNGAMLTAQQRTRRLPFVELTEEMHAAILLRAAPRAGAAPGAKAPGAGAAVRPRPGTGVRPNRATVVAPVGRELDEATDREIGERLRRGREAGSRQPR